MRSYMVHVMSYDPAKRQEAIPIDMIPEIRAESMDNLRRNLYDRLYDGRTRYSLAIWPKPLTAASKVIILRFQPPFCTQVFMRGGKEVERMFDPKTGKLIPKTKGGYRECGRSPAPPPGA